MMAVEVNSGTQKSCGVQFSYGRPHLIRTLREWGSGWFRSGGAKSHNEDEFSAILHWLKRRATRGALMVVVALACVPLVGCGDNAITTSQLTAWAQDAGAQIRENSDTSFPPTPGLHIRYAANEGKITSFAIRLTPTTEQRQDLASSMMGIEYFPRSDIENQDIWHRGGSQEHRTAFAESLSEADFAGLVGNRIAAAVDEALRLDSIRTDSDPYSRKAKESKSNIAKWSQPVVNAKMSSWTQSIGGRQIDLTFSEAMRGQVSVPAEVIVSMAGYDAIAPDPLFVQHPLIPDGVRRDLGFTPLPVIEHLNNGGVAYRVVLVDEDPSIDFQSHFLLVDREKKALVGVVILSDMFSSDLLKSGDTHWYEVFDQDWESDSDNIRVAIGEWSLQDGVVVMSLTFRNESSYDIYASETRIEVVLPADSVKSESGMYSQSTRTEFLKADVPPVVGLKTASLRIEAVVSPRRVPEYAHCEP
jgi:hypothetical protein